MSSEHVSNCQYCGIPLPENSRPDRFFCSAACRRSEYDERAKCGTVRSVRYLKSGKMSLIIWTEHDSGVRPGDRVRIGEEIDSATAV